MGDWTLSSFHKRGYGRLSRAAPDPNRCAKEISAGDGWEYHQCSRKRGHGPEQAYCKQHSPDAVKERQAKREERWKAEQRERVRMTALSEAKDAAFEACQKIAAGHNDPQALAKDVLEMMEKSDG